MHMLGQFHLYVRMSVRLSRVYYVKTAERIEILSLSYQTVKEFR